MKSNNYNENLETRNLNQPFQNNLQETLINKLFDKKEDNFFEKDPKNANKSHSLKIENKGNFLNLMIEKIFAKKVFETFFYLKQNSQLLFQENRYQIHNLFQKILFLYSQIRKSRLMIGFSHIKHSYISDKYIQNEKKNEKKNRKLNFSF